MTKWNERLLATLDVLMKIGMKNATSKNYSTMDINIYVKYADMLMAKDG